MRDRFQRPTEEEAEEARLDSISELFLLIREKSLTSGIPSTTPRRWSFETKRSDTITPFTVIVNPNFEDENRIPQVVVVDVDSEGKRIKQCVIAGVWQGDRPLAINYTLTGFDDEGSNFDLLSVLSMAKQAVKHTDPETATSNLIPNLTDPPGTTGMVN